MPSEYTDEIENSSYTRRAFSMGRKSRYSAEKKLLFLKEALRDGPSKVMTRYNISKDAIRRWKLLYKYQGLPELQPDHHNQSYSRKFKHALVEQYRQSTKSMELFAIRHGLRS